MTGGFAAHEEMMKGRAPLRRPPLHLSFLLSSAPSAVAVDVFLGLADFALGLAFHLLGFALELFARVTGQAANGVAELATDFLSPTLGLVLQAIRAEIVCHDS